MGNDQSTDAFADEALADYYSRRAHLSIRSSRCKTDRLDRTIKSYSGACYYEVVYVQGARFLDNLRRDYGNDIARVFPQAVHHVCIFHALRDVSDYCRKIYGTDYAETHPEVEELRQDIRRIFAAKTKRTALKRYAQVMERREAFVQETPQASAITGTSMRTDSRIAHRIRDMFSSAGVRAGTRKRSKVFRMPPASAVREINRM